LTPVNYLQLEQLYQKYKAQGFAVLAFPCNQFGGQEPGSNADIKDIVRNDKNATFPLFAKVKVNGNDAHPVFQFLTQKLMGTIGASVMWNFTKFLVDRDGLPVKRAGPPTKPLEMEADIQKLLAKPPKH